MTPNSFFSSLLLFFLLISWTKSIPGDTQQSQPTLCECTGSVTKVEYHNRPIDMIALKEHRCPTPAEINAKKSPKPDLSTQPKCGAGNNTPQNKEGIEIRSRFNENDEVEESPADENEIPAQSDNESEEEKIAGTQVIVNAPVIEIATIKCGSNSGDSHELQNTRVSFQSANVADRSCRQASDQSPPPKTNGSNRSALRNTAFFKSSAAIALASLISFIFN